MRGLNVGTGKVSAIQLDMEELLSYIDNKLEDVLVAPEELGNLKGNALDEVCPHFRSLSVLLLSELR